MKVHVKGNFENLERLLTVGLHQSNEKQMDLLVRSHGVGSIFSLTEEHKARVFGIKITRKRSMEWLLTC